MGKGFCCLPFPISPFHPLTRSLLVAFAAPGSFGLLLLVTQDGLA
ncbi:MAG: hypothetical protein QOC96_2398 [Acidobacteriota bacterium]|jgi:hypothetical protein|nr:hypothetical protein [Acidobacteriota bacterium]